MSPIEARTYDSEGSFCCRRRDSEQVDGFDLRNARGFLRGAIWRASMSWRIVSNTNTLKPRATYPVSTINLKLGRYGRKTKAGGMIDENRNPRHAGNRANNEKKPTNAGIASAKFRRRNYRRMISSATKARSFGKRHRVARLNRVELNQRFGFPVWRGQCFSRHNGTR